MSKLFKRKEHKSHISRLVTVVMFMFLVTGCAGYETLPESTTDEEQVQESSKVTGEPETEAEESDAPCEKEPQYTEEEECPSFRLISPEGEQIEWAIYSEGVYCYSNGRRWGYLSEDGEEITPCIYENAAPFSEGLACVGLDGKYGYIGRDGEEAIPFCYDQAASFREGAAYFSHGEEYGLIDHSGRVILDLTDMGCESISSFREGLAYFSEDGLYGYMDKNGKVVIKPVYGDAGYFREGLAEIMKDGYLGLIGKDGREVLSPEYSDIRIGDTSIIAKKDEAVYCFDKERKEIFSGTWDNIWEGENVFYIEKDSKKGLADQEGHIILEPVYMEVVKISERELVIVKNEDEKCGVVDFTGQTRVPFIYSAISDEEGGLKVRDGDTGKEGLLDKDEFSVKIPVVYDYLKNFTGGKAVAGLNEKAGVIRYDGTLELPIEYEQIRLFSDGAMFAHKEREMKLTDAGGNLILDGYGPVWEWGDGYVSKSLSSKRRYWNRNGLFIVLDDAGYPELVDGAENSHVLNSGSLLRSGEENGQNAEQFLLSNQITPEAGVLYQYLKTGHIVADTGGPEFITDISEILQGGRAFCGLYRIEDQEEPILYVYAVPWRRANYQESDSGLFTVCNGQTVQLVGANECGGSIRGDKVCFWYDTKEKRLKPGAEDGEGGWGGYASGGDVYEVKNGQAVLETSFRFIWSPTPDGGMEEEYMVNKEEVSEEEYNKVTKRYRNYIPIGQVGIW